MKPKKERYSTDPQDGLLAEVVGDWVVNEKHERLVRYVDASRFARRMYIEKSEATFIDLFCGPGRVNIRNSCLFYDGGVVAACRMAREKGVPYNSVHIGDIDHEVVDTCAKRLRELGETVTTYYGSAENTVNNVVDRLNSVGLHLAYLDPYNLDSLPFVILNRLSNLKRMDMLIHVSVQDLQRNLPMFLESNTSTLDRFAPDWRNSIKDSSQPNLKMRAAIMEHWLELVRNLGMSPSKASELVTGPKGQRLYWLMFASRNEFPEKLWNQVRSITKQGEFF